MSVKFSRLISSIRHSLRLLFRYPDFEVEAKKFKDELAGKVGSVYRIL
jgi:hypothetical protein